MLVSSIVLGGYTEAVYGRRYCSKRICRQNGRRRLELRVPVLVLMRQMTSCESIILTEHHLNLQKGLMIALMHLFKLWVNQPARKPIVHLVITRIMTVYSSRIL